MSGLELQAKLKHAGSSIPIIFITALGDIPMAVHAMREGAVLGGHPKPANGGHLKTGQ
jgi:FixJ family two-component response regulator